MTYRFKYHKCVRGFQTQLQVSNSYYTTFLLSVKVMLLYFSVVLSGLRSFSTYDQQTDDSITLKLLKQLIDSLVIVLLGQYSDSPLLTTITYQLPLQVISHLQFILLLFEEYMIDFKKELALLTPKLRLYFLQEEVKHFISRYLQILIIYTSIILGIFLS